MLKTLRKKLTALAACLTGAVVLSVCLISFLLIRNQYLESRRLAFRLAATTVATQWELDGYLSSGWLSANMEANDTRIALWENRIPMDYGFPDFDEAQALRELVPNGAGEEPVWFSQGALRCAWMEFSFSYGSRQILVWQDTAPEQAYLLRLGLTFGGIALVGLIVVGALCYLVAGRAIAPAQEAMERQEHFVAAASHELRSPLTALRTGFGVLRATRPEDRRTLELMSGEADRMSKLVDELLLLAGGGSLRRCFQPRPVELDTILIDFADSMTPVAEKKGVYLKVQLPEEAIAPVSTDPDRIRQLLSILTDNALRYAPVGSAVLLSLVSQGRSCVLSVADQGPGVPDAEKKKIFDRFYRGSQSRTDPSHFGLGLSVAWELAAVHGGKISVSDTPGGGATFSVTLPMG